MTESEPMTDLNLQLDQLNSHVSNVSERLLAVEKQVMKIEVEISSGPKVPMWAKGLLVWVISSTFGAVWWASSINTAVTSMPQLSERLTSAFQGMRNSESIVATVQEELLRVRNELDGIHKRTVEGTDDRWRKRDDERRMDDLQKYLNSEFGRVFDRLTKLEERSEQKDALWQRLFATGVLKDK